MRWAEPDVWDAATRMREVFEGREAARARAAAAGARIRAAFSLDAVGAAARDRLLRVREEVHAAR